MFGKLSLGYYILLALLAGVMLSAFMMTDYTISTYFGMRQPGKLIALWFLPPLIWLCWLGLLVIWRKCDRPTKAIVRLAIRHRFWLLRGFGFGLMLLPVSMAFLAMKRSIPKLVPYYADPIFADADRLLFFGTDPWRITHFLFGPLATSILDRVYLLWFPSCAALLGWFMFTRDPLFQLRGLLTYLLTWFLLGSLFATLLSSVGPVYYGAFYGADQFAPLTASLHADDAHFRLYAVVIQEGLLRWHRGDFIGAAISAMPSLHVAMAFLIYLVIGDLARRWRYVALAYFIAIWVGSVHLGWHYAIDGLFSVVVVGLIWWATGRFVHWLDREEPAPVAEPDASSAEPVPAGVAA